MILDQDQLACVAGGLAVFHAAGHVLKNIGSDGTTGALAGAGIGALVGIPGGPAGMGAGAATGGWIGGALGTAWGAARGILEVTGHWPDSKPDTY